jgi:hypothetical protein
MRRIILPFVACLDLPYISTLSHAVAQLVEALHYKPAGRGFDSPLCHWIFSLA